MSIEKSAVIISRVYTDLTNRLTTDLEHVPTWNSPKINTSVDIRVRALLQKNSAGVWDLEVTNSEVQKEIDDQLSYIVNKANAVIDTFKPESAPETVFFDLHWEPLAYRMKDSKTSFYISTPERDEKFSALSLVTLGRTLDIARQSNSRVFLFSIGGTLLCGLSSWPLVSIAVMIVNTYLDEYIPAVEGVEYKVVSYEGFKITYQYVSKLFGEGTPAEWNLDQLYKKFVDKRWMPNIPVKWNEKDIELMKVAEIKRIADEYAAKCWGVKDAPEVQLVSTDEDGDAVALLPVPETIESSTSTVEKVNTATSPPFEKGNNPYEIGFLNLSVIMDEKNPGMMELEAVFPADFFSAMLPVILDTPLKIGRVSLKNKNILACMIDCGTLVYVFKKGVFTRPQLAELRKRHDDQYMTTSTWIDESNKDAHNYIGLYNKWMKQKEAK